MVAKHVFFVFNIATYSHQCAPEYTEVYILYPYVRWRGFSKLNYTVWLLLSNALPTLKDICIFELLEAVRSKTKWAWLPQESEGVSHLHVGNCCEVPAFTPCHFLLFIFYGSKLLSLAPRTLDIVVIHFSIGWFFFCT